MNGTTSAGEWRQHWPVVLIGMLGVYTAVIYVYSAGLFILPLAAEFGWSRASISTGPALVSAIAIFANPCMGALLDRVNPQRIIPAGAIFHGVTLAALALTGGPIWTWWLGWTLVGLACVGVCLPVWLLSVVKCFHRARGTALGVTFLGSAFASMSVPIITAELVGHFGWRGAYIGLGGLALITGFLPSIVLRRPVAPGQPGPAVSEAKHDVPGLDLPACLRSTRFWRIGLACFFATMGVLALTVHFVPIVVEKGLTTQKAAAVASVMGLTGIAGRVLTGLLLDRFPGRLVAAGAYTLPIVACVLLQQESDAHLAILFAALIGLSLGSELDVMAYLTTRYFGLRHYGLLFGILTGIVSAGAGVGPILAGWVHDRFDSYTPLGFVLSAGFAVSAICALSLGRYPQFEREAGANAHDARLAKPVTHA